MSKRITFRKTNLLENISKKRLFLGVLAGLLFSFIFYSFLFSLREVFRVLFSVIIYPNFLMILESNEVSFYNYIFAIFSSILGLSFTLKIIFEKPKQFGHKAKYYYRKSMLFNSISFVNVTAMGIILRIVTLPIFIFGTIFPYYLSYYDEYKFLIYLILIVLFLEQWKIIRLIFKNRALKWMTISLASVLLYSFVISKINIINYKKINTSFIKNQAGIKNELTLSAVINYKKITNKYLTPEFFIAYPKNGRNNNVFPLIVYKNEEYSIENISEIIENIKSDYSENTLPLLIFKSENTLPLVTFKLNIDKNIKMRHVSLIKQKIAEHNFSRIVYGVLIKNSALPKEVQFDIGMFERLQQIVDTPSLSLPPKPIYKKEDLYTIVLGQNKNNINTIEIENILRKSPKKVMHLKSTDDANLNDYLQVKDALLSIYHKLRNEYAIQTHGKTFYQLNRDQIRDIKKDIYPMIIWLDDK